MLKRLFVKYNMKDTENIKKRAFIFFLVIFASVLLFEKLSNRIPNYSRWMTYGNFDVPNQKSFINYLKPGIDDEATKKVYKFKKIHWHLLLITIFIAFPILLLIRVFCSLDLKLGIKRYLTQFITFFIARTGIFRVTGACPVKRSGLGVFPFLNCQSCELATGACPLGTFQMAMLHGNIPLFVGAYLGLIGIIFGRALCGWLCPFGFLADIFNKFSKSKKTPLPHKLSYIKYFFLAIFIGSSFLAYYGITKNHLIFCSYFCPGGFFYGVFMYSITTGFRALITGYPMFHIMIIYHYLYAVVFLYLSYKFGGRFFCKYACPIGTITGLFNKISLIRILHDEKKCTHCGACQKVCPMDIDLSTNTHIDYSNCITCMRCVKVCHTGARSLSISIPGKPVIKQNSKTKNNIKKIHNIKKKVNHSNNNVKGKNIPTSKNNIENILDFINTNKSVNFITPTSKYEDEREKKLS